MQEKKEICVANGEIILVETFIETKLEFEEIPNTRYKIQAYILENCAFDLILGNVRP